jgi:hypothetical protein
MYGIDEAHIKSLHTELMNLFYTQPKAFTLPNKYTFQIKSSSRGVWCFYKNREFFFRVSGSSYYIEKQNNQGEWERYSFRDKNVAIERELLIALVKHNPCQPSTESLLPGVFGRDF